MAEKIKLEYDLDKEFFFDLPKMEDERGNLSFLEIETHVPFRIARTYWVYDVPGGQERGSHAFKSQQEVIIALSGSFDVILDDGEEEKVYTLNRSYKALYVPCMTWRTLTNFSTNSVCLILNSGSFSEEEYLRNYTDFIQISKSSEILSASDAKTFKEARIPQYNTVFDCSILQFPIVRDRAGNITPVESNKNIPFDIERVFYIYDIPSGAERGMHAHRYCHEVLIATTGSFEVELDDGVNKRIVRLNSPSQGLHIPPGVRAREKEYSSGATCLALASEKFGLDGYINSYEKFKEYRGGS